MRSLIRKATAIAAASLGTALLSLCLSINPVLLPVAVAQPPSGNGPPRGPVNRPPDPRVEQRTYHFDATGEDLPYALFVSSKVMADVPAPLIVALHGLGGDANSLLRGNALDLADAGGYIVVGPMGYNSGGWYGSPVIVIGGGEVEPPNLAELSEQDVLNVLAMIREEFDIDDSRTYLMGHSMGGAGALFLGSKYVSEWAAVASIAPAAFRMQQNAASLLQPYKEANVPVIVIQGDRDTAVPVANTRTWIEAMDELDMIYKYVELGGGDHGTVINDGMPDIFEFFGALSK
jgi:poly(3-hydroxybutyrate) depolymerase